MSVVSVFFKMSLNIDKVIKDGCVLVKPHSDMLSLSLGLRKYFPKSIKKQFFNPSCSQTLIKHHRQNLLSHIPFLYSSSERIHTFGIIFFSEFLIYKIDCLRKLWSDSKNRSKFKKMMGFLSVLPLSRRIVLVNGR